MLNRTTVTLLLVLVGLAWALVAVVFDVLSGQWLGLPALVGIALANWFFWRGMILAVKNIDNIKIAANVSLNLIYLLQHKSAERREEILTTLSLPPEAFRRKFGPTAEA